MNFFSIKNKLFTYIATITILALIISSTAIYVLFFQTLKNNAIDNMIIESKKSKEQLETFLKLVVTTGSFLATDKLVIDALEKENSIEKDTYFKNEIDKMLKDMLKVPGYINNIYILSPNSQIYTNDSEVNEELLRSFFSLEKNDFIANKFSYTKIHNMEYSSKRSLDTISYVRPVFDLKTDSAIGTIIIDINYAYLKKLFAIESVKSEEKTVVLTDKGEKIYAYPYHNFKGKEIEKLIELNSSNSNKTEIFGEQSYIISTHIGYTKWKIFRIVPAERIYDKAKPVQTIAMIVTMIFIVLSFFASYILSTTFTRPIKELNSKIKMVENGELDVNVQLRNKDELGVLSNSFNKMVNQLRNLISDKINEEKKKSEMEFKILQSQINPHFLYNTLDSVKWLAIIQNVDNIADMITALINLLKYNISKNNYSVNLRDELNNVKNYIKIQKYRYGDIFRVIYSINNETLDCTVLRFMLQPIVENVIIHAFEEIENNGEIEISSFFENNQLVLTIMDNGIGMNVDEPLILKEKKNRFSGIGLKNIEDRIKLYFGLDYGLQIFSEKGKGTNVKITLPIIKNEK
ncbi:sensor histidine kinase [Clostridium sediminicola]|uniref:sensor histidine kinase n=1 Tax=Clostridium sediminicola TaxID=3114879 RepID=UPI0031F2109A